ncbi:MAG: hypothetical protein C0402_08820, partial [Thermodesulfovibrio sp.]|nr:hypothetical protein [Thermodesulfovibrio sp.]
MTGEKKPRLRQLLTFGVIVFVMVIVLALLNWLPMILQKNRLQKFSSVEAARKVLHMQTIYLPTYIPETLNLAWPPAEIYAQDTPFRACIIHFTFRDRKETGLTILQTDTQAPYELAPLLTIREKKKIDSVSVKNRRASLVSAVCDQDIPCNQL